MNLLPNDWGRVREHYQRFEAEILAAPRDEWAISAYAWDNGFIFMTPIEYWMWCEIRGADAVMYPQYPVGRYFVDFANPVAKVAIECDGAAYHQDKAKDQARDKELERMGWTVYRITGKDCRTGFNELTGEHGAAYALMALICDRHHITRRGRNTDWMCVGDGVRELMARITACRADRALL